VKSKSDIELGMQQDISRRDFLNGVGVAVGAALLPTSNPLWADDTQSPTSYYPPSLTGIRGNHAGSFEIAHALRDGNQWEATDKGESYDLVVVGAGISGLSAAHYYRKAAGHNARILILDNHDDFGGHAKRNEFVLDGRTLIGYGGTESIESPGSYPKVARDLIKELGIDTQRFYTAFDQDLYDSLNLKRGTFFNKETFGADHLAAGSLMDPKVLQAIPMSDQGKADLVRFLKDDNDYLPGMSPAQRLEVLKKESYLNYLRVYAGLNDEVLKYADSLPRNTWAMGGDALPAAVAWSGGNPGFADMDLGFKAYQEDSDEPWIFHFPDGNATISRLLVRRMIPAVAPGDDMEDILTDTFDYSRLDESGSPVRIRLNSTVVRTRHQNKDLSGPVEVTYVNGGKAHRVKAEKVVMAGFHAMAPMLCPEIPEPQRNALSNAQRAPMFFTNVLIRNWTSFKKLGLSYAYCPGSYHNSMTLDFPVSLGGYTCPKTPEEPMILHMVRTPGQPGLSAFEQFKAGKRELMTTSFETFERNIRDQLGRVLGAGGFDPARDIAGITVNRWPHGYAYGYDPESGQIAFEPQLSPTAQRHWQRARQRFGNISFAGTDASSNAMTESAIEEAYRAIEDLKPL
jgi:spermidine dehydrogenase